MSAPLYELTGNYLALLDQAIDEETGLVRPEFEKALAELEGTIEAKLEGCAKALKMLASDAESLEAEVARLEKRRSSLMNNADRLKEYMRTNMIVSKIDKLKTKLFTIYLSKPKDHVVIENMELVPEQFLKPQPAKPDLMKIKEQMQEGLNVPGARLATGLPTLNIR